MPDPEHEHSEHMSSREADEVQRKLELAGDWDDDMRREAVRMNRDGSGGQPKSFRQAFDFLMEYQDSFAKAAQNAANSDEDSAALLQETAHQLGSDIKAAWGGDPYAMRNLMTELESDLQVRAQMERDYGAEVASSETERDEIRDLRQTRDALFGRYESLFARQHDSGSGEIERTGMTDEEASSTEDKRRDQASINSEATPEEPPMPEISREEATKQLGQALFQAGNALRTADVPQWFRQTLGRPENLSPAVMSKVAMQLHKLYVHHSLKGNDRRAYPGAVQNLFTHIKEEQ